ncbi:hypothetical protein QBC44DRAFT_126920 [Cladorrhinum sp. PSN332]|nr:hypothetical protein QBC44DRAFT_126920 [Cladorrhinum sp. PSN332]
MLHVQSKISVSRWTLYIFVLLSILQQSSKAVALALPDLTTRCWCANKSDTFILPTNRRWCLGRAYHIPASRLDISSSAKPGHSRNTANYSLPVAHDSHPRAACPVHVRLPVEPVPDSFSPPAAVIHCTVAQTDPSVAQLPLVVAIRSARSPPPSVSIAGATLHASRGATEKGMNGDHNSTRGSTSEGAPMKVNAFVPLTSQYANSFTPTTATAAANAMTASTFQPAMQPFRVSRVNPPSLVPVSSMIASSPSTTPPLSSALVKNLPYNISGDSLRLMLAFSNDLVSLEILPAERSDEKAPRTAHLRFKTPGGALEVKHGLDGKKIVAEQPGLSVEIMGAGSPTTMNGIAPPTAPAGAPTAPSSRQTSRFNGTFQTLDKITTAHGSNGDISTPIEGRIDYANLFSTQSPIGNHIAGNRASGKNLIDAADDEETDMLLHDPVGYAENGLQRRQTAPQIPMSTRMAGLSLNTNPTTPGGPRAHYGHSGMNGYSGLSGTMSPTVIGPTSAYNIPQQQQQQQLQLRLPYPPVNPADQHPPCNTLYVGNLPIDTSEEELKQLFCRQRGYKRLCFRTKANGPMCFVEFEDVTFATRALTELYGHVLTKSSTSKGGIRLSFSKNPLGVRSGQTSAQGMLGMTSGFTTASGPPPGLAPPPGLGGNRLGYTSSPGTGSSSNFSSPAPTYSNAQYSTYSPPTFQSPTSAVSNVWGNGFMYSDGISGYTSNFQQQHVMHQRS